MKLLLQRVSRASVDIDGQTVASAKATASGNAVISLPEKGSTAYILKAGESTFKIGVK